MKKLFFSMVVVALGLVACNKNEAVLENTPAKHKAPVANNIRVFNSFDEVSDEIDKISEMSFDKLVAYENSIGFNSFGKNADLAYNLVAANEDNYKSVAEVQSALSNYSNYLQITEDETGYNVETKLGYSALYYIINDNQMYQVNDTLVKILQNATVLTTVDNYKQLLTIGDANINEYQDAPFIKIIFRGPSVYPQINHLGKYIKNYQEKKLDGRWNKLIVEVYIDFISYTKEKPMYRLQSWRKGIFNGVYWTKCRDIEYNITITPAQCPSGSTVPNDPHYPQYNTSGIRYNTANYKGDFKMPPPNEPVLTFAGNNNVFVRTRGYAKYSSLYVSIDRN